MASPPAQGGPSLPQAGTRSLLVLPFTLPSGFTTGRNLENSPEALVEFTEFAEAQSLNLEIFRPLQSGEKPTGLLLAGARAGPSAEPQLMRTGSSDGGFVLAGVT